MSPTIERRIIVDARGFRRQVLQAAERLGEWEPATQRLRIPPPRPGRPCLWGARRRGDWQIGGDVDRRRQRYLARDYSAMLRAARTMGEAMRQIERAASTTAEQINRMMAQLAATVGKNLAARPLDRRRRQVVTMADGVTREVWL